MIREIVRESLIRESKIADITTDITVDFELWKDPRHGGAHMKDRKVRHGKDQYIYDLDIKRLIDSASKDIAYHIYDNDIRNRQRFVVSKRGGDWLNVVVQPEQKSDGTWNLVVITVMRTEFFNVRNQVQIWV